MNSYAFRIWYVILLKFKFPYTWSTNHKFNWWSLSQSWCFSVVQITLCNKPRTVWVVETEIFFIIDEVITRNFTVTCLGSARSTWHLSVNRRYYIMHRNFQSNLINDWYRPSRNQRKKRDPLWKWCKKLGKYHFLRFSKTMYLSNEIMESISKRHVSLQSNRTTS